jgi:hypothetical protein
VDDQPSRLDENTLERLFSWVRLFRGVGAAIDAKKLILAALGLLVFGAGSAGLDRVFAPDASPSPWRVAAPAFPPDLRTDLNTAPWRLTEPVRVLVGPFAALFTLSSGPRAFLHALLAAVWGASVWGLCGGAIARIAAVQVARGEHVSLGEAARFARRNWVPLIGSPLCPLLGIAFFAVLCAALGLLYRVPLVGPTIAGVLAVVPLLAGLVMTIILVSLAAGWPLMHATVAAEAEDGFDALSRSFAYVNQRPIRYAGCLALAWALGIVGLTVVDLFARTTVYMAHWALGLAAPATLLDGLFEGEAASLPPAARATHAFWLAVVALLAHAWIYSYFWTAAVTIYLILRRDVDGTPWHAVAPAERRGPAFDLEPAAAPPADGDRDSHLAPLAPSTADAVTTDVTGGS